MIDEGPFQNFLAVGFPGDSPVEDFIDREDACGQDPCGSENYLMQAGGVRTFLGTGRSCVCDDAVSSGGQVIDTIWFTFRWDTGLAWPKCMVGCSSGAKIQKSWPDAPANWGSGSPGPISFPDLYRCSSPLRISANTIGLSYRVIMDFLVSCSGCDECS